VLDAAAACVRNDECALEYRDASSRRW